MTVSSGGARRRRLSQVPVAALAAGAVAVLCGVVAPAPQARAQATPCAVTEVTVVVAGQGTGCAPAGLDGLTTLRRAGFSVTMVQTQPGFICRINGTPAIVFANGKRIPGAADTATIEKLLAENK